MIGYETKYYKFYEDDNALHYLRLQDLEGSTKQKIKDIKTYITDKKTMASAFRMFSDYDIEQEYGSLNMLIREIFSKVLKATIINEECLDIPYCRDEYEIEGELELYNRLCDRHFEATYKYNDRENMLTQIDMITDKLDDDVVIPEINNMIVYSFWNYDMFDFGGYEGEWLLAE